MVNKWPVVQLGEIVRIKGGKRLPKGSPLQSEESEHPYIRVRDMGTRYVPIDILEYVPNDVFPSIKNYIVEENDVIISIVGTIGLISIIDKSLHLASQTENCAKLSGLDSSDAHYLYYYLNSYIGKQEIKEATVGAVQAKLPLYGLNNLSVIWPERHIREKVVQNLIKLDDKIELNRQTNQILEQMAQALFESWFVDFDPVFDNALASGMSVSDFPEALQKKGEQRQHVLQSIAASELDAKPLPEEILKLFPSEFEQTDESSIGIAGWIPKGWKAASFESLIKLIGGGTPKTTIEEYWSGDIPWFSVVDAPKNSDVFVIDTEKHVTQLGVDKSSTKILRNGTTIISARGTVGKCALVAEAMAMNQSCYGINGIKGVSDEFIYFMTRHQVSDLQKRGHGSVFNTITRETFKSITLAFCGGELTQKFSETVTPLLNKILLNNKQNTELEKTRDILLPKLISGELQLQE